MRDKISVTVYSGILYRLARLLACRENFIFIYIAPVQIITYLLLIFVVLVEIYVVTNIADFCETMEGCNIDTEF